jgi:hypothetical protein
MSAENTTQGDFYAPWPDKGKKLSFQLEEIRTDTSYLFPLVRAAGYDSAGDFTTLDGVEKAAVQAWEYGKQDFHNKFRTHYNKTKDVLELAYNNGTTAVPNWYTTWWIDGDGLVTQQNTPTTASNIGSGEGWFKQKVGVDLEFKTVTATSPITIVNDGNSIDVDGSALVSTYSSLATPAPSGDAGVGIEQIISDTGKSGNDLPFKGIGAGANIVIENKTDRIEIQSTAQVVEFYGIQMRHADDSTIYKEVHNLKLNVNDFYLTQEKTNPSNKTVILNARGEVFESNDYVAVVGDEMTGPLKQADGSEALPSFTFTIDPTMGLSRNAANDLAVSIGGSHHTRFLSDRLLVENEIQLAGGGTAANPDLYFFPDSDTGLFQTDTDTLGFTTGGVQAGMFTQDGDFYARGRVLVQSGNNPVAPDYSFANSRGLGMYNDLDNVLSFATSGVRAGYFNNSQNLVVTNAITSGTDINAGTDVTAGTYVSATTYVDAGSYSQAGTQFLAADGSTALPGFAFTSNPDCGLYLLNSDDLVIVSNARSPVTFDATTREPGYGSGAYWIGHMQMASNYRLIIADGGSNSPGLQFKSTENPIEGGGSSTGTGLYLVDGLGTGGLASNALPAMKWWASSDGGFMTSLGTKGGFRASPGDIAGRAYAGFAFDNDGNTGLTQIADGDDSLAFLCGGVVAGYFDDNDDLYVTRDIDAIRNIHAGGDVATTDEAYGATWDGSSNVPTKNAVYDKITNVEAQIGSFYGMVIKESGDGAVMVDDTLVVNAGDFYLSGSSDGKPHLNLQEDVLTVQNHPGLHNIEKLNAGGLGLDEAMGMSIGAGNGLIHFYVTNTRTNRNTTDPMQIDFGNVNRTFTPPDPYELTAAGSDDSPIQRFIWLEESGSTAILNQGSDWPTTTKHARLATAVYQTAAGVERHGALKLQAWTDHPSEPPGAGDDTRGERGHLHAIGERLRQEPAVWKSGMAITSPAVTDTNPIYVITTAGTGYQMHKHVIPAFDSSSGVDPIVVVNAGASDTGDFGAGPYMEIDSLDKIGRYSDDSLIGNNDSYTLILWASINENSANSKLFCNVPSGGYGTFAAAQADSNGYRNYQIPGAYLGTAIYLCEFIITKSVGGTVWTVAGITDLRGTPGTSIGGTGTSSSGEANTASNLGDGAGVFNSKVGIDLQFKSIRSDDAGISVTNDADEIFIGATGTFYTNVSVETPGGATLTVGDMSNTDSIIEFFDANAANPDWTLGRDESLDTFNLAKGAFGDANDYLRVSTGKFDFRGHKLEAGRVEAGIGTFYMRAEANAFLIRENNWSDADHVDFGWIDDGNDSQSSYTGFRRSAADEICIAIQALDEFTIDTQELKAVASGMAFTGGNTGYAASSPQFKVNSDDSNTGIWQPDGVEDPDTLHFSTGGVDRGFFDSSGLNLDLVGSGGTLSAGRVEAGHGVFYTSLDVDGDLTMTATPDDDAPHGQILLQQSTTAPSIADVNDRDSGIGFTPTALMIRYGNANIGAFSGAGYIDYKGITMDTSRHSATTPAVRFENGADDAGIIEYIGSTSGPRGIGHAIGGNLTLFSHNSSSTPAYHVEIPNELRVGRIHSGPATFYAQMKLEGGNISNLLIGADDGDNHTDTPQIAFASEPTSGFGYNESSGYPMITKAGSVRMFFPASYIGCSDELRVQGPGTSTDPSLNFTSDPDTGIYQLAGTDDGTIAFSSQTGYVGHFGGGTSSLTVSGLVDQSIETDNVTYGLNAASALASGALRNTILGHNAGNALTTADDNTFVGNDAGMAVVDGGFSNTFVGSGAGAGVTTGDSSVAIGQTAFNSGLANQAVAIGGQAGKVWGGIGSIFIGYQAGLAQTSQNTNVFIGYQVGKASITSSNNTFMGYKVADALVTGNVNTAVGSTAGGALNGGTGNALFGFAAGSGIVAGGSNTYIGAYAGQYGTGDGNTCIGRNSGAGVGASYDFATFVGNGTGQNATGDANLFFGYSAGAATTTGINNHFLGVQAGFDNVDGDYNIVLGYNAGSANISGSRNINIGERAGQDQLTSDNIMIGYRAGYQMESSGNPSVFLGNETGYNLDGNVGGGNVFIGHNAGYRQTEISGSFILSNERLTDADEERTNSLIFGEFYPGTLDDQTLRLNAGVTISKHLVNVPDEITATSEGVAASLRTINTEVTTNGDSDLDNVTLADGDSGQIKNIYCVVEGNAADTWKITPATMCGGTQITFAGVGEGCTLVFADSEGWVVTSNNGGTIS